MDDTNVILRVDGKDNVLTEYALVYKNGFNTDLLADATLPVLGQALIMIYRAFVQEAATYSDQDIYELCKQFGLEYDYIMELIREERNGQN